MVEKILDMALLRSLRRHGSMLFIAVLCLVLNLLSSVSALSLSIPPLHTYNTFSAQVGSSPTYSNKIFGIPSTQRNLPSQRMSAATNNDNISLNNTRKQRELVRLSKISQHLLNLRNQLSKRPRYYRWFYLVLIRVV